MHGYSLIYASQRRPGHRHADDYFEWPEQYAGYSFERTRLGRQLPCGVSCGLELWQCDSQHDERGASCHHYEPGERAARLPEYDLFLDHHGFHRAYQLPGRVAVRRQLPNKRDLFAGPHAGGRSDGHPVQPLLRIFAREYQRHRCAAIERGRHEWCFHFGLDAELWDAGGGNGKRATKRLYTKPRQPDAGASSANDHPDQWAGLGR